MEQQRIHVGSGKKISPEEIIFLRSDINYTNIFLANGKKLFVSTTLGIIETRLKDCGFFRTHRSTLVNLDYVEKYTDHNTKGELSLFKNNKILVSRRKNKTLKTMKINFLTLLLCSFFFISCGRSVVDPLNTAKCEKELNDYEKAINAWAADPASKIKCEAVKVSLNNLVKNCAVLTAAEKKQYQDELKDFNCN